MHNANLSKELVSRAKLLKSKEYNFDEVSTNSILNDIFSLSNDNDNNFQKIITSEGGSECVKLNKSTNLNFITDIIIKVDNSKLISEEENTGNLFENLTVRESVKIESSSHMKTYNIMTSPSKFYKEGSSLLDNDFFKNFLAFNKKIHKQCDKELVDSLLNVTL